MVAEVLTQRTDDILSDIISMGYHQVGNAYFVMKPMSTQRIMLDWLTVISTSIHIVVIPMQCSFGYLRYWGSVHVLVLIMDFLCFVDIVSNMCTGFFMEKDMELGEDEANGPAESEIKKADTWKVGMESSSKNPQEKEEDDDGVKADKLAREAGVPTLIMDHNEILNTFIRTPLNWFEMLAIFGWYADVAMLKGDGCLLFLMKAIPVFRVSTSTLTNLATHSLLFKYISSMISNQTALTYYVGLLLGFSHWVGCLFLFFAWRETSKRDDEAIDGYALTLLGQDEQWTQYVVSIYWALQTTLTVGYGDVDAQNQTWVMMTYSCVIGITSLLVSTFFTASATVWLSNLDASKRDFTRKLKVLQEFLQTYKHCVPPDLKRRLFLYLDYNQQYNHERNIMEEMLSGMPKQVRTAVKLATTQDLIRKVRLFRDTTPNFISAVVMLLKPSVVLNGDAVFRYGDFGEEMYFLDRGHLHVLIPLPRSNSDGPGPAIYTPQQNGINRAGTAGLKHMVEKAIMFRRDPAKAPEGGRRRNARSRDGQSLVEFTKVASLHSGAYFGEIALFNSESTRTATIQAIVNSTYFTLSRKDFEKICPSFPSVAVMLKRRAHAMVEQNKKTITGNKSGSKKTKISRSAQAVARANNVKLRFKSMVQKVNLMKKMSAVGLLDSSGAGRTKKAKGGVRFGDVAQAASMPSIASAVEKSGSGGRALEPTERMEPGGMEPLPGLAKLALGGGGFKVKIQPLSTGKDDAEPTPDTATTTATSASVSEAVVGGAASGGAGGDMGKVVEGARDSGPSVTVPREDASRVGSGSGDGGGDGSAGAGAGTGIGPGAGRGTQQRQNLQYSLSTFVEEQEAEDFSPGLRRQSYGPGGEPQQAQPGHGGSGGGEPSILSPAQSLQSAESTDSYALEMSEQEKEDDNQGIEIGGKHMTAEGVSNALAALGRVDDGASSEEEEGEDGEGEEGGGELGRMVMRNDINAFESMGESKKVVHLCREILRRNNKQQTRTVLRANCANVDYDFIVMACRALLRPDEGANVKHTHADLAFDTVHAYVENLETPELLETLWRKSVDFLDASLHDEEEQDTPNSMAIAAMALKSQLGALRAAKSTPKGLS